MLERIDGLPTGGRRLVMTHLRKNQDYPFNSKDYESPEPNGSILYVSIMRRYHIFYWVDTADSDIKILRIDENE